MIYKGWNIEETPCYTNSFKITEIGFKAGNEAWRYFASINLAKKYIDGERSYKNEQK